MAKYRSRIEGFRSRIPHWLCESCGVVFIKTRPGECSACGTPMKKPIYFPSRKEYNRYVELCLLEKSGHIDMGSLERQPRFTVTTEQIVILDFRYTVHGREVFEDVKTSGTDTNESKRRRKLLEEQHKIKVVLV